LVFCTYYVEQITLPVGLLGGYVDATAGRKAIFTPLTFGPVTPSPADVISLKAQITVVGEDTGKYLGTS
jgi:hypothetical protein